MGFIIGICLQALGFIFNVFLFLGFGWWLLPICSWLGLEMITGLDVFTTPILHLIIEVLCWIAAICTPLQAIQNLVRKFKKDTSFNIFKSIFGLFKNKKGVGFTSKIDGSVVNGANSSQVNGFVFGKDKGKYITKPETTDGHILVVGGAGSGKTSGIAIPSLMSWKDRVFAIDIKGELYQKTKSKRDINKIKVFNPTDRNAYGYDPFYMLRNTSDISSEARQLALAICPMGPETKDPFWIKSAQNLLTGLLLYYFLQDMNFSETVQEIKKVPVQQQIAHIMSDNENPRNNLAQMELAQFVGLNEKTLSGIFTELSNRISIFATNMDLQEALSGKGKCITPKDLEDYDIYCCIPEHKLEEWKDLLGMMCNQFLKSFERRSEDNQTPILFLIDEFPRLGKIEAISNGLATLRSKKIHIALFVQSKAQLNVNYGKDMAEVITDNCSYKAILKASEPTTQEWCSKLVGTYDKEKKSSSYNTNEIGMAKGMGTSTTTEDKPIIKPEEFSYLQDVVCIFPNGYRRIKKIKYWEDETFSSEKSFKNISFKDIKESLNKSQPKY